MAGPLTTPHQCSHLRARTPATDAPTGACVIDYDNICHRGFDKVSGVAVPQAQFKVLNFVTALRACSIVEGTICRNHEHSALAEQGWRQLGFDIVTARCNCDRKVVLSLILYVERGFRDLILVAGDGDYAHAIRVIRRCGVAVEVWSRRATTSSDLMNAADGVRFIDEFLTSNLPANQPHARHSAVLTLREKE